MDQDLEYNVVLKAIAKRNMEVLKMLLNPSPHALMLHPKRMPVANLFCDNKAWSYTIMSYAWPLFNNITGAREHMLRFLYPGAEIIHEKVD